ncbi:hypothetical protein E2542_SST12101 [Spatholobus suberectus]|nr:hypothetical protein E2542_SST12101 [Spatholobus suberectus]
MTGQAVSVGSNSIYMGFKDEEAFDYPTWEWQDHVMAFDDEFGENLKYMYGTYTQRLKTRPLPSAVADASDEPLEKEEEDKQEEKLDNQGLKELINTKDSTKARILHRNVNTASPRTTFCPKYKIFKTPKYPTIVVAITTIVATSIIVTVTTTVFGATTTVVITATAIIIATTTVVPIVSTSTAITIVVVLR